MTKVLVNVSVAKHRRHWLFRLIRSKESKCVKPAEMNIVPSEFANYCSPMVGSEVDVHGCIPSAGYVYCEAEGQCIRPWELKIPVETVEYYCNGESSTHGCRAE